MEDETTREGQIVTDDNNKLGTCRHCDRPIRRLESDIELWVHVDSQDTARCGHDAKPLGREVGEPVQGEPRCPRCNGSDRDSGMLPESNFPCLHPWHNAAAVGEGISAEQSWQNAATFFDTYAELMSKDSGPKYWFKFAEAYAGELRKERDSARWIPVNERLPEPKAMVLVVTTPNQIFHVVRWAETEWVDDEPSKGFIPAEHVTHWRPLPKPPLALKDQASGVDTKGGVETKKGTGRGGNVPTLRKTS